MRRLHPLGCFIFALATFGFLSAPAAGSPKEVDEAVKKLLEHVKNISGDNSKQTIHMYRPHPAVRKLTPEDAPRVLEVMMGKITGDPAWDTYIRFHLIDVVIKGTEANPEPLAKAFSDILKITPEEYKYEVKPFQRWEPPDLGRRYSHLLDQCRVTVGFPPFQRHLGPPESFEFMSGEQRRKAEAAYKEALQLKPKVKLVTDQEAAAHNSRGAWLNWVIRQTRGELAYGMLMSGDPRALDWVVDEIAKNALRDPVKSCDLASFFNMAMWDGWLSKYDDSKLKAAAKTLKQAARTIPPGAEPRSAAAFGWFDGKGRTRSLPETLFTPIILLESGKVPLRPNGGFKPIIRQANAPATRPAEITSQDLTLELIDYAIARALNGLERMQPPQAVLSALSFHAVGLPYYPPDLVMPGQWALATQASLASGESFQRPEMMRRILWVLCADTPSTYDRAMRLQVLAMLPTREYAPWVKRDVDMLINSITQQGNFVPTFTEVNPEGFGDNANGQYGVLGLWAAARAGHEINPKVWQLIDKYWREAQWPGRNDKSGGWAVNSAKSLKPTDNPNDFRNQVSAPMTAAGVLTLSLTERFLYGPKRLDTGQGYSSDLAKGLAWLDENFNLDQLGGDEDIYYYIWTIQNVGQATGYRTLNGVDWYRESTARLLNTQDADGLWTGPKGKVVSTSFALLYLYRARGPLAICKLRFAPAEDAAPSGRSSRRSDRRGSTEAIASWNNRPHDLVNYTDYLTAQLETPTSWQIADLDQPTHELIETPILYLATDKPVTFSEAQLERIRAYIAAGGMLVAAPEGRQIVNVVNSFKAIAKALYPDRELKAVEKPHPFLSLFKTLKTPMNMLVLENEVRPLMVIVERDISRDLQANYDKARDAFDVLANIYLYATGRQPKRPRILTNYVIPRERETTRTVTAARVKYAGVYDPEPFAMTQLRNLVRNDAGIDLKIEPRTAGAMEGMQLAFLTISPGTKPTEEELKQLRDWMEKGGTLWLDFAGGHNARAQLEDVLKGLGWKGTDLKRLRDHAIMTGEIRGAIKNPSTADRDYNRSAEHSLPTEWWRAEIDGRPALLVCTGDLMSGMAGLNHWNIAGPTPRAAREILFNTVLWLSPDPPPPPATKPATQPTTKPAATKPANPANPATRPATNATTQEGGE